MKKKYIVSLATVGLATFSGLGYVVFAVVSNTVIKNTATEAVVLDHAIPFYYRMLDTHSLKDLGLLQENQFTLVKPAAPIHGLVSMLPNKPNLSKKVTLSPSDISSWTNHTVPLVNNLFLKGSSAYNHEMSQLHISQSTINGANVIPVDGGIRQLKWTSLEVKNGTAVLQGTGDSWASFGHWQNGQYVYASPHNEMTYSLILQETNGSWKVTNLSWDFAPGSQP